jgi:hypothetical protein
MITRFQIVMPKAECQQDSDSYAQGRMITRFQIVMLRAECQQDSDSYAQGRMNI